MTCSRRQLLAAAAGLFLPAPLLRARQTDPTEALAALEARAGGRLGVCLLDTRSGVHIGRRMHERFAICSTFKLPLAAVILREAERGVLRLDESLRFSKQDLVPHAPVVEANLAAGALTVAELAEAAQVTSDNVAANLLLRRLGGPAAFTQLLRAIGDSTTRLDRWEPELNLVLPGEDRDTTTPHAMAETVMRFAAGDLLAPSSRERLIEWMVTTSTGSKRIRAGLPRGWRAGDKTGTASADAMTDKINDVAVAWPPDRPAIVVTAYYDSNRRSRQIGDADQAVLADVGRIAAAWLAGG